MKKLTVFASAMIFAIAANAQINIGANFLMGFPSGNWHTIASGESLLGTGFGGSVEVNYFVMEDLAVGLEVGFNAFGEGKIDDVKTGLSASNIPISLKAEYYFLDDNIRPFVGFGFGYYLVNMKADLGEPWGEIKSTANGLGISPRVGAIYQLSDALGLVLNVNYNVLFGQKAVVDGEDMGDVEDATNFIGIGLGARFNLTD